MYIIHVTGQHKPYPVEDNITVCTHLWAGEREMVAGRKDAKEGGCDLCF